MAKVEGEIVEEEELGAEEEARRRLALAQIRQYPDVALKMAARPVEEFDEELGDLVERMKRLMHDAHGIGLAANQVGVLRRIFVFTPAKLTVKQGATITVSNAGGVPHTFTVTGQKVMSPDFSPASS